MPPEVPLASLAPGHTARVLRIAAVSPQITRRLIDLGFVPQTEVRVVRRAPLGDPCEYEVRGTRLCLRRSESAQVWVETIRTTTAASHRVEPRAGGAAPS